MMVQNRGNVLGYTNARTHVPIPRADEAGYRAAHQPQEHKPESSFDWDWNNATCTGCQTSVTKSALVDGRCPTCRGVQPVRAIRAQKDPPATFTEADLDVRYHAPEPLPELPPHDGTRLGRALAELEAEDPVVAAAAARLDEVVDQIVHPEDHVKPANLDLVALACEHATRVLTRSYDSTDPIVGLFRTSILATIEALDVYLELHHTPQISAAPTPPGAGAADQTRPAQPARAPRPRTHRPARPRVEVDETVLISQYLDHHDSVTALARRHHIGIARVQDILRAHNVQIRQDRGGRNRLVHTSETIAEVVRRYVDDQQTLDQIEADTGIEHRQVRKILNAAGVPLRPSASQGHISLDDQQRAEAVERYLAGRSLAQIGAIYGVGSVKVREIVTAAGHTIRVKGSSSANAQRLRDLGITAAQVKDWALATGLVDIRPAGLLPGRLIDAYETAHPTQQNGTIP